MANSIIILATKNTEQTNLIVQDKTDWTVVTGTRSSLTDIIITLYLYNNSTGALDEKFDYQLTSIEEATYQANGIIEIPFLSFSGETYIDDGFYYAVMTATSDTYESNYSGYGITIDTTYTVYSKLNSVHTPENLKYDAEEFILESMFLEGMNYLENSNVNQRDVKFSRRYNFLQMTNL